MQRVMIFVFAVMFVAASAPLPQAQAATVIKPQSIVATGGTITTTI